jgi:hypothetical protein
MRSRSIEYFLSPQDIELVTDFVRQSLERFEKYDGRARMAPKRFNTDELQRLYIVKYGEWDRAVKTRMPDASSTYLDFIRESGSCPIERFLKAFMQVIEQSIHPNRLQNMLQRLESELAGCEFSCPCPGEP